MMAYCCLIFTLATIGFAMNVKFIQMTYIDYRNYPGGPNAFTFEQYTLPINVTTVAVYVLMNWFSDGLMLYRFMVIYQNRYVLLIIPGLIYAGIVAMSLAMLTYTLKPEIGFFGEITIKFGTAYWALSISLNIIITTAIAGRLLKMRAAIRKVLGPKHSSPYTSVLSMIVESAALYTAWALMFLVPFARQDTFQNIVLPALGQVQGIAPLLIILRVAQGKAWTSNTADSTTMGTSMDFASRKGPGRSNQNTRGTNQSFPMTDVTDSTVHLDDPEKSMYSQSSSHHHHGKVMAL